ncbi:MAG: biotin--[acetyl-CoA-carboxylase] ligase, partial [Nocardioides sp.]
RGLHAAYVGHCATIGQQVRVELPDGASRLGSAVDVDRDGRLLVRDAGGVHPFGAGDVVHVRRD